MGQSAGANSIQHLIGGCRTSELVARAFMSSGSGDEPVLFGKIESEESRYPFWMEWKSYTGCNNLKELRALPVSKLYDAFQMMFSKGFQEVMSNMGPVADQAEFRQTGNIPAIPYMAGGNREDMKENLHLAALHWTRKQAVPSYAYYFCRQLPGDSAGAWHSADLWYWFGTLNRCWRPFTKEDQNLSEMMVRYLMNFAETGNPNDASLPEWKSSAQDADQIMVLDAGTVGMKKAENTENKGIFGW